MTQQHTGGSDQFYVFDPMGNPTTYQNSAANFTFDPENRLTNITAPMAFSATYDGDGLRASKTAAGTTTYYLYDGDTPLLEETQSGATTTVTAGNGEAADGWRARYYPGSLMVGSTDYGHQYYAYLYDPQGNLIQRQAQNNQTSDVMDTVLYDAYGNPSTDIDTGTGAAEAYQDPVGFGGQYGYYTDTETGLSLLTNRYYDSGRGRFINRDPIGYGGGINLYGFCGNNPVMGKDPNGTSKFGDAANVVGLVPGPIGMAANLASAGDSLYEGDYLGAALSIAREV